MALEPQVGAFRSLHLAHSSYIAVMKPRYHAMTAMWGHNMTDTLDPISSCGRQCLSRPATFPDILPDGQAIPPKARRLRRRMFAPYELNLSAITDGESDVLQLDMAVPQVQPVL